MSNVSLFCRLSKVIKKTYFKNTLTYCDTRKDKKNSQEYARYLLVKA